MSANPAMISLAPMSPKGLYLFMIKREKKHIVLFKFIVINRIYEKFSVREVRLATRAKPAPISLAPTSPSLLDLF